MEQVNWATEWLTSLLWIARVWVFSMIGFGLVMWLIIRRTQWGRQFWRLSSMFFIPRQRTWRAWKPLLLIALLLLLAVADVRLSVILSFSNNGLYTALQELDASTFWGYVGIFGVIAAINVVLILVNYYVAQAQIIQWRLWLNQRMVGDWLSGSAYHRGRFVREPIDNPDQRIEEDISSYTSLSQSLAIGAVSSMVTLVSFTIILWGLSGPLTIAGITIPRAMVFIAFIYVLIATVIAIRIGHPLVGLNFLNERLRAYYRYALIRVRENSENVAFYRGEQVENATLTARFGGVIANTWAIVFRSLKFQGFNLVVNQIAVVFPLVIQAPRYFSGQVTLGDVTQTATAFGQVQSALSFFRLAYDDFAGYQAVLIRLNGLLDSNDEARGLPTAAVEERPSGLGLRDLTVRRPDGQVLIDDLDLDLPAGGSLLVKGPSGSGKTTLLRSLAGLWPHVEGTIARPAGPMLFCSQQPYLPLGTLRTALAYPAAAETLSDDGAEQTLRTVQLGHLSGRLDEFIDWSKTLSPGEQQRLAFGRLLLGQPAVAFLDESSSALDEGMEHALYTLLRERLPQCTIVSVGHRSTLEALHAEAVTLTGEGQWEATSLVR